LKAKFSYVGIRVKSIDESLRFYTELLGMTEKGRSRIESTKGDVVTLQSEKDGFELELNHYDEDSPYNSKYLVGEGLDHLAFQVEDLDKALLEARRQGYSVVQEVKSPTSRWAYVEDPNGVWIELF
jgi:methylmalonyl-CoA/ethylmalonyl-CoA epimerase